MKVDLDEHGRFRIDRINPGEYQVHVRRGLAVDSATVRVEPGQATDVIDFTPRSDRGGWVVGRLVDGDGRPMAGCTLRAQCREISPFVWRLACESGTTDADGRFRLGVLPEGMIELTLVDEPGGRWQWVDIHHWRGAIGDGVDLRGGFVFPRTSAASHLSVRGFHGMAGTIHLAVRPPSARGRGVPVATTTLAPEDDGADLAVHRAPGTYLQLEGIGNQGRLRLATRGFTLGEAAAGGEEVTIPAGRIRFVLEKGAPQGHRFCADLYRIDGARPAQPVTRWEVRRAFASVHQLDCIGLEPGTYLFDATRQQGAGAAIVHLGEAEVARVRVGHRLRTVEFMDARDRARGAPVVPREWSLAAHGLDWASASGLPDGAYSVFAALDDGIATGTVELGSEEVATARVRRVRGGSASIQMVVHGRSLLTGVELRHEHGWRIDPEAWSPFGPEGLAGDTTRRFNGLPPGRYDALVRGSVVDTFDLEEGDHVERTIDLVGRWGH